MPKEQLGEYLRVWFQQVYKGSNIDSYAYARFFEGFQSGEVGELGGPICNEEVRKVIDKYKRI